MTTETRSGMGMQMRLMRALACTAMLSVGGCYHKDIDITDRTATPITSALSPKPPGLHAGEPVRDLALAVWTDKAEIPFGESIGVSVEFQNVGAHDLHVVTGSLPSVAYGPANFGIDLSDSQGRTYEAVVPRDVYVHPITGSDITTLKPGQTFTFGFYLRDFSDLAYHRRFRQGKLVDEIEVEGVRDFFFNFTDHLSPYKRAPSHYQLALRYVCERTEDGWTQGVSGIPFWEGLLASNVVMIQVTSK